MRGVYIAPPGRVARPDELPGGSGRAQPPASRASASRSTRPPAESPVWASSPTSSTIEAASSLLLGGCTGRPDLDRLLGLEALAGHRRLGRLGRHSGLGRLAPGVVLSAPFGLCRGALCAERTRALPGRRGLPRGSAARAGALRAGAGQARQHARLLCRADRRRRCAGPPASAGSFLFARGAHWSAQSSRIGGSGIRDGGAQALTWATFGCNVGRVSAAGGRQALVASGTVASFGVQPSRHEIAV